MDRKKIKLNEKSLRTGSAPMPLRDDELRTATGGAYIVRENLTQQLAWYYTHGNTDIH